MSAFRAWSASAYLRHYYARVEDDEAATWIRRCAGRRSTGRRGARVRRRTDAAPPAAARAARGGDRHLRPARRQPRRAARLDRAPPGRTRLAAIHAPGAGLRGPPGHDRAGRRTRGPAAPPPAPSRPRGCGAGRSTRHRRPRTIWHRRFLLLCRQRHRRQGDLVALHAPHRQLGGAGRPAVAGSTARLYGLRRRRVELPVSRCRRTRHRRAAACDRLRPRRRAHRRGRRCAPAQARLRRHRAGGGPPRAGVRAIRPRGTMRRASASPRAGRRMHDAG